jgi:hypothetical protein
MTNESLCPLFKNTFGTEGRLGSDHSVEWIKSDPQDATGTMVYLQFEAIGKSAGPNPLADIRGS